MSCGSGFLDRRIGRLETTSKFFIDFERRFHMRNIFKLSSIILFLVLVLSTPLSTFASADSLTWNEIAKETAQVFEDSSVTYQILDNGNVVEEAIFYDNDKNVAKVIKTISPNGFYSILAYYPDGIEETINGQGADYETFYKLANDEITLIKDDHHNNSDITTFGSDITGSQYKHVYIGTPGSYTIYGSDLKIISSSAVLAGKIYSKIPGAPYKLAVEIAGAVISFIGGVSNYPYKVVISTTSYEVHLAIGGYYTHCYHSVTSYYNSSNKVTSTQKDYYQAIGG